MLLLCFKQIIKVLVEEIRNNDLKNGNFNLDNNLCIKYTNNFSGRRNIILYVQKYFNPNSTHFQEDSLVYIYIIYIVYIIYTN